MTDEQKRSPAHRPVSDRQRNHARAMRRGMTDAERRFWYAVRAGRFQGLVFRRQVPIAGHIVDFACHERRLIVEIDGATHTTDPERHRDARRTQRLEAEGYRVVRFWNDDVKRNLPMVLHRVYQEVEGAQCQEGPAPVGVR